MAEEDLDALLNSALEDFNDEAQAAAGAAQAAAAAGAPAPGQLSKEAIQREVCGKFSALLAIFESDVQLEGEYRKEFQALAEKQLTLLKKACEEGGCTTRGAGMAPEGDVEDALSQAVRDTVDLLKNSKGADGAGLSEEEVMKQFSAQLQGMDSDPSMAGVMESMMSQLLSKEFLYESLSDMAKKYPGWLEENAGSISAEDNTRYCKQLEIVKEIVHVYDTDPENMDKVVELLQGMQACGQPPPDIIKDLGGGVEFDEAGQPKMPEQCVVM